MKFVLLFGVCLLAVALADHLDYYTLLGVERNVDDREIRKAFKKLALLHHPDKNPGDERATQKFVMINRAYEVLKNEKTRNIYDMRGEEGLRAEEKHQNSNNNNNRRRQQGFHEYEYYSNNFGIYDNDEEIITLNTADFEESVGKLDSDEIWFINFYSPFCSHCHVVAPEWRKLAKRMYKFVRIGAVNCGEERQLCQQENIQSYPSLMLYPKKQKFQEKRDHYTMLKFIMANLDPQPQEFTDMVSYQAALEKLKDSLLSRLMISCHDTCLPQATIALLNHKFRNIAFVYKVECSKQKPEADICTIFHLNQTKPMLSLYSVAGKHYTIEIEDVHQSAEDIYKQLIAQISETNTFTKETFESFVECLNNEQDADVCEKLISRKMVLVFYSQKTDEEDLEHELKSLRTRLLYAAVRKVQCDRDAETRDLCRELLVVKYPTVYFVAKHGESYESYHGRFNAHDMANFADKTFATNIVTMRPELFESVVVGSMDAWLIQFHSPWCPMCKTMMQAIRRAYAHFNTFDDDDANKVLRVGTIDCTIHVSMCRDYNIRSYPTVLLYNASKPHQFPVTKKPNEALIDFIDNIFHYHVIQLNPIEFADSVENRKANEVWVVEFFSPYCRPCVNFAPTWAKLARYIELANEGKNIKVANVNCARWGQFCQTQQIRAYPDARLYPALEDEKHQQQSYVSYNLGTQPSVNAILTWVYEYYPFSNVTEIDKEREFNEILDSPSPHVVNFYAPWAASPPKMWTDFIGVAKNLTAIRFVRLNCALFGRLCHEAAVKQFPAVRFYEGTAKQRERQPPKGIHISIDSVEHLTATLHTLVDHPGPKLTPKDEF